MSKSFKSYQVDFCYNSKSDNKMASSNLSQKIKNLEIEGLKLRSQVENILNDNHESSSCPYDTLTESDSTGTVRELRFTHDPWVDSYRTNKNNASSYKTHDYKEGPKFTQYSSKDENTGIRKELDETRDRLAYLQQKLKQENQTNQLEREKLLKTIEDLELIKQRLEADLNNISHDFEKQVQHKDSMIHEMKSHLSQLVCINKQQEETLAESAQKINEVESSQTCLKGLRHLRQILKDHHYYQNQSSSLDYTSSHISLDECSVSGLVNCVDRCLKEMSEGLENRNNRIRSLEDEVDFVKRNVNRDKEKTAMEWKHKLTYQEEQNGYLKKRIEDQRDSSEREIERMRHEYGEIQRKLEDDLSHATSVIDGLERNLQEISNKQEQSQVTWSNEKKKFESLIDDLEKQLASLRSERDLANTQKSSIVAKYDATQYKLNETESQLIQHQTDKYTLEKQLDVIKKRNSELESNLTATRICLESITKTAIGSKSSESYEENDDEEYKELDKNLMGFDSESSNNNKVPWKPKKYEVQEVIRHIKTISKKLGEVSDELNDTKQKLQATQKQLEMTEHQKKRVEQSLRSKDLELEGLRTEIDHVNSLMGNRNSEVERLTAERDYYFQMLNEKSEELSNMKTENHKLNITLEERCRQLERPTTDHNPIKTQSNRDRDYEQQEELKANTNQNNAILLHLESSRHKNQLLKQEKQHLAGQLSELKKMKEEIQADARKYKANIEKLQSDNNNLQRELRAVTKDYDDLQAENKRLQIRIKESEKEINTLCQELQTNSSQKSRKHISLEKKLVDLTTELTKTKNELKISQDSLKSIQKSNARNNYRGGSPVPPLVLNEYVEENSNQNHYQQPIISNDKLKETRQKINNLEQQMKSMEQNYEIVQKDNQKLTNLLKKVTSQNEKLTEELENYVEENRQLRENSQSTNNNVRRTRTRSYDRFKDDEKRHTVPSENKKDFSSIKTLRDELESSIKDARKLLSSHHNKYDRDIDDNDDDDDGVVTEDSCRNQIKKKQGERGKTRGSNNNNSAPDCDQSKTITQRTTESSKTTDCDTPVHDNQVPSSLTEVDRHLVQLNHLSNHRVPIKTINSDRPSSPVERLLSPVNGVNSSSNTYLPMSNRDSYLLEEKIKRLLTET